MRESVQKLARSSQVEDETRSMRRPSWIQPKEHTMLDIRTLLRHAAAAVAVFIIAFAVSASAADILDDWATAKAPAPPELKPQRQACGPDRCRVCAARWRVGISALSRQIFRLASGRETESAGHQDGHPLRHFVSRGRRFQCIGCGRSGLQGDRTGGLPIVTRRIRGASCGHLHVQRRPGRRQNASDADAQHDGKVLTLVLILPADLCFGVRNQEWSQHQNELDGRALASADAARGSTT
jgi:hypothetical protein